MIFCKENISNFNLDQVGNSLVSLIWSEKKTSMLLVFYFQIWNTGSRFISLPLPVGMDDSLSHWYNYINGERCCCLLLLMIFIESIDHFLEVMDCQYKFADILTFVVVFWGNWAAKVWQIASFGIYSIDFPVLNLFYQVLLIVGSF